MKQILILEDNEIIRKGLIYTIKQMEQKVNVYGFFQRRRGAWVCFNPQN